MSLIILFLCSCCISCSDGDVIISVNQYQNRSQGVITNNSSDNIYTWLDLEASTQENNRLELAIRYMFKPFGDFNLCVLLTDNVAFPEKFIPVIGKTFLKRIKPGDSFFYIVDKRVIDDLQPHIIYITETELASLVGYPINDFVLFSDKSIELLPEGM